MGLKSPTAVTVILGLLGALLVGCRTGPDAPVRMDVTNGPDALPESQWSEEYRSTRAFLFDRTVGYRELGHGTQVEYTAPDGAAYLWYPGNARIVPGRWRIQSYKATVGNNVQETVQLCYLYGANTYNPMTKEAGGKWECRGMRTHLGYGFARTDSASGDVLGLARSPAVPFIQRRDSPYRIADLAALIRGRGAPPTGQPPGFKSGSGDRRPG